MTEDVSARRRLDRIGGRAPSTTADEPAATFADEPTAVATGEPAAIPAGEPAWLRDESGAEAALSSGRLAERVWTGIRLDPGRRGTTALVAVGIAAAIFAAFLLTRGGADAVAAPPLPDPAPGVAAGAAPLADPEPNDTDIVVSVVGTVVRNGLVTLPPGSRIANALEAAGGALPGSDLLALNLAQRLVDGDQVVVGHATPGTPVVSSSTGQTGSTGEGRSDPGGGSGQVSLNSATEAELDALPGVGPVTAASIVAFRSAHGPFTSVDQLGDVDGIGPARLNTLRELVVP